MELERLLEGKKRYRETLQKLKEPTKHNIFDVAHAIFRIVGGELCPRKIDHLCFYCQCYHLVFEGAPFFLEDFTKTPSNQVLCLPLVKALNPRKRIWYVEEKDIDWEKFEREEIGDDKIFIVTRIIESYGCSNLAPLGENVANELPCRRAGERQIIKKYALLKHFRKKWKNLLAEQEGEEKDSVHASDVGQDKGTEVSDGRVIG